VFDSGYEKWVGTGIETGEKQEKWVQGEVGRHLWLIERCCQILD
jgi:hypothetical protein